MADQFDPYHKWLGIPAWEQPPHHYRLLGLTMFESDADVIESAADQRMAHVRTFQCGEHSSDSQKLLNELAAAKLWLLTPERKTPYDTELMQKHRSPLVSNEKKWHTVRPVTESPGEIPLAPAARRRRFKSRPVAPEPLQENSYRPFVVAGVVVVVLFLAVVFGRDIEKFWSAGQTSGQKSAANAVENQSKAADTVTPDFFKPDEPSDIEPLATATKQPAPEKPDFFADKQAPVQAAEMEADDFFTDDDAAATQPTTPAAANEDFFTDGEPAAKPASDTSFFDDN
ncbi:MAG TPA: hypothetical protein VFW73_04390 [Lacipirellulaceae bacterium]|nr:hypothetical protein [Lacipirellulaceae bacterium]